jgi:long-chain acyl-CoA synthetase
MVRMHPDAIAWHNLADRSDLSFRAWDAQANQLARGLVRRGLRAGERVVIAVGPDEPFPWLITYAAVHRAGAVAVPVNTRLAAPELRAIITHADPTVVIASPTTGGGTSGTDLVDAAAGLRVTAITETGSKATDWSALFDPDASALAAAGDAGVAMDIMYTSGTTGAPKAVVVRHDLPTEADPPPDWHGLGFMTSSPFSTTSGALLVYGPMSGGLSGWYQPRFDPGDWLALAERRRPVVAFIVPAMAQLIVAHPRFAEADLSSLAALTIGGAPVARPTLRRLGERLPDADVLVGYGLTEFGAVTRSPSGDMGRHLGSVGRPLPGIEIRIVNTEGGRMGAGQVGEITVRGPGPPRRYYKAEHETSLTWRDGWMHSGDLGYLDDEGFLWITGRIKDLIIRGGHNVAPGEIEEVLFSHPAVIDAVAAGIPHDVLGEDVGAWVVLSEGSTTSATELRRFMLERLADYKVPRQLHLVESLPRNDAGKVVRAALEVPPPEPATEPDR